MAARHFQRRGPASADVLSRYHDLDCFANSVLDKHVQRARALLEAPYAFVVWLRPEGQWRLHVPAEMPLETAPRLEKLWAYTIEVPGALVIDDLHADERFRVGPLTNGGPDLRAFAGIAITTADGHQIGVLGVLDEQPRYFTRRDQDVLATLAAAVMAEADLHHLTSVGGRAGSSPGDGLPDQWSLAVQPAAITRSEESRLPDLSRGLLDQSPTLVLLTQEGRVLYVNRAGQEMLGATAASDLVGRSITEFIAVEHRAAHAAWLAEERSTAASTTCLFQRLDGKQVYLQIWVAPVEHDGTPALLYVGGDVTDKQAVWRLYETALVQVDHILERISDAFFSLDRGWRFTYLNTQAERLLALSHEEAFGKSIWELFPEAVGTMFYEAYHRALHDNETVSFEAYYPPHERWYDVTAYPDEHGLSIFFRDSTERKKTQEELDNFFQLSGDLLCIASTDGYLKRVNPTFEQTLGYTQADLCSRPFIEFVHPDDRAATLDEVEWLKAGEMTVQFENRYRCQDGSYRWLSWTTRPMADGTLYGVVRDVTEDRDIREALRESEERLELALSGAEMGLWDWNVQSGAVIFNERWAEMLGYRLDEIEPHVSTWKKLVHPDDLPGVMEVLTAHLEGRTERYETEHRMRTKDGGWKWILDRGRVVERDAEGNPLRAAGTHLDITERKRAEQALGEVKGLLAATLDALPAHVAVLDETGTIIMTNTAWRRFAETNDGSPAATGAGVNYLAACAAAEGPESGDAALVCEALQDLLAGERTAFSLEYPCHGPDEERWFNLRANQFVVGDTVYVVTAHEDISALKRTEQHLQQREASSRRLANVAARTINGVVIADSEGRVEWVNEGFTRISGYTLEEVRGRTPGSVLKGPKTDPDIIVSMREKVRQHQGFQEELINYHKSGRPYWVRVDVQPFFEDDGSPSGFIGLQTDITERVKRERDLQASEERWRRLVEHNPEPILICEDIEILYVNPAAAALVAAETPDEVVGRTLFDFVMPEQRAFLLERLEQLRSTGAKTTPAEYRIRCLDGEERIVESFAIPVEYQGYDAVQVVVRDVTARNQFEQSLVEAKDRAEEVNRMKSVLLENMSHELRTPLASILGVADILMEEVTDEQRELIGFISEGGNRLLETLKSVLDLSQLESGSFALAPERLDVADTIQRICGQYELLAQERQLYLRYEGPTDALTVWQDPSAVERVVSILLSNALKFTDEGGITVAVQVEEPELVLAVRDTGVGINEDFLPRVFEEFEQASSGLARHYEGSGLGLAIARRLVHLMGGTIEVDSTLGEGSVFTVRLPLRADEEDGAAALADLTPREQEILELVAQGMTSAAIADRLSISERTVEKHRSNIIGKLGLEGQSPYGLLRYALRQAPPPPPDLS